MDEVRFNAAQEAAMKFRHKYTLTKPFSSWRHDWLVIGRHGAVHLHISEPPNGDPQYGYSAGLEAHYRSPPDYMRDAVPSHERCWAFDNGSPCWHDGTSLYAQEHYLPIWLGNRHGHEGLFLQLEGEYRERFAPRCEAVSD